MSDTTALLDFQKQQPVRGMPYHREPYHQNRGLTGIMEVLRQHCLHSSLISHSSQRFQDRKYTSFFDTVFVQHADMIGIAEHINTVVIKTAYLQRQGEANAIDLEFTSQFNYRLKCLTHCPLQLQAHRSKQDVSQNQTNIRKKHYYDRHYDLKKRSLTLTPSFTARIAFLESQSKHQGGSEIYVYDTYSAVNGLELSQTLPDRNRKGWVILVGDDGDVYIYDSADSGL